MKKILMIGVAVLMVGFLSIMVKAGNQYNWGTNTGGSWITPDNTNIQYGQALVITSTTNPPAVGTSSTTPVGFGGFTITQINASSPTMVGLVVFCNNCSNTPLCVSTGATGVAQSYASVVTSTSGIRNDCR